MICRYCGRQLSDKATFCGGCGKQLKDLASVTIAAAPESTLQQIQPPVVEAARHQALTGGTRTARGSAAPVAKARTLPIFAFLVLAAALFGGYRWYQPGVTLTVLTTPPGSVVGLDGNDVGTSDSGGKLVLEHIARKNHTLTAAHDGYQALAMVQGIGPFAFSANTSLTMQQQTYRMTVQTKPPSSNVFVDDKSAGKSDAFGVLIISAIADGQHTIRVESPGLPSETLPIQVHGNDLLYTVDLAAKMEEINQEKLADLERARALFQNQDFDAASAACDAVLNILPNDSDARALKTQIQQTKAIVSR